MSYFDYEKTLLGYMDGLRMQLLARPLNLGGVASSGGSTGGGTGYIGQLPQTRVVYDMTEAETMFTPLSGTSLVDNLNHIRGRLSTLENTGAPGTITIKENGVVVSSGITIIDFVGGDVSIVQPGEVTVTFSGTGGGGSSVNHIYNELVTGTTHFTTAHTFIAGTLQVYYNGVRQDDAYFAEDGDCTGFELAGFSAGYGDEVMVDYDVPATASGVSPSTGGHTIQNEGISLPSRTYLNFVGAGVTASDDSANNRTNVTISVSGGGTGEDEKVKISANDTTADYLFSKLVAGTNITIIENNDGGNETLTIVASGGTSADEKVKVSSNDTTAGYLLSKLVAGTNVTLTENSDGGNETITITASGGSSTPQLPRVALLTFGGTLSGVSNPFRIYNVFGATVTISKVFLAVDVAPIGQDVIVDINKNGTTIFSTQSNRPTIAAGSNTGETTAINTSSWAASEYLTADIDQIGTATPGSNLSVHIVYS